MIKYEHEFTLSIRTFQLGGNPEKDPVIKLKGDRVTTFLVYVSFEIFFIDLIFSST